MSTLDQYRQMHQQGHFSGHSTKKWMPVVSRLCAEFAPTTLLDYGCGKGDQWKTLAAEWMIPYPALYDPAVPGIDSLDIYSENGTKRFDGVLCLDVLEHLEGEELNVCISNCLSRANKFVFFGISTRLAKKCLPDGRNCHITVQPLEWWKQKVGEIGWSIYPEGLPMAVEIHDEAYIE
jgi:hypothetical protein